MHVRHEPLGASLACLAILLTVTGPGCREAPKKRVSIVDGVEVVVNPAVPLHKNPGRVLKVREKLRIRDTGDTFYFKGPGSPEIAPDGSIFIKQIGQLLRFSPEGAFLGNLFKPGQGPGEIEMPLGYLIEGDGVRSGRRIGQQDRSHDARGPVSRRTAARSRDPGADPGLVRRPPELQAQSERGPGRHAPRLRPRP